MQTRKNRKNKTFNRKNRGGGPKSNISKKTKPPDKKIEKIASAKKININPIPLSKSPQSPNFLLSLLPNNKKEYESKKIHHEIKKENYKKYKTLNEIYGGFFEKLNELIVLFKSVDTDYINEKKLQSIIDSNNNVKANIVDGLKLYDGITHLENEPDINIDYLITERQNYIDKIEDYKTKINKIIEIINQAKAEEIKKKEEDAIKKREEEEEKKQKEEEYKKKKTAKKEKKKETTKIQSAATKIQSMVRGKTARERYNIKTMRESAKKKAKESAERKKSEVLKKTFEEIINKTPQEITGEEWSTFFKEDVEPIKRFLNSGEEIRKINETNGFREYYENKGAKYYSHVIFFILGFLTPLLEKKDVTMYLKGGQAIHLNKQTSTYPDYKSNDIDIDFIIDKKSGLEKKEVCYMIRNFIYWCVSDNDIVNIENIKYSKNLTSIENETNVLKMSFREFPTSGQIFALMDMSFKDGLPDIKNLFTPEYIEHKGFEINGITHNYNYQSVLSLILEKIFILLHANDPNIDIATKPDIINKFKATLQYTLQLYIAQPENTTEKISTEYSKLFNVDKKAIQEFINDVLYPGKREQQKQQERELERQKQQLEREQNRELESLLAALSQNIKTFQNNHSDLFNTLYNNNKSIGNVNDTIQNLLTKNKRQPTLADKKEYILIYGKISVEANINEYLNNNDSLNYLKNKKIDLKKVIHEWNKITNIKKYIPLSQGIPSNSFQGMSPLRQPTYKYLY